MFTFILTVKYCRVHKESCKTILHVRQQSYRTTTIPEQWTLVPTHLNPAEYATRFFPANRIQNSLWLRGPLHLYKKRKIRNVVW